MTSVSQSLCLRCLRSVVQDRESFRQQIPTSVDIYILICESITDVHLCSNHKKNEDEPIFFFNEIFSLFRKVWWVDQSGVRRGHPMIRRRCVLWKDLYGK